MGLQGFYLSNLAEVNQFCGVSRLEYVGKRRYAAGVIVSATLWRSSHQKVKMAAPRDA